ncbi:MAG: hypothetical protein KAT15_00685 [Bacteroidales bacterium]|nr:hypothetical protein [Bacteroidales bacterium]
MLIRNSSPIVFFLFLNLVTISVAGQQQVDLDQAEIDNPDLFTGGFIRTGVGFTRSNFTYGTTFDGIVLNPLYISMDFGKRMNRNFGAYFSIDGNVLIKEKSLGFDEIKQWAHAALHVGGLFYFRGNSYFAPEIGLDILTFEYTEYQVAGTPNPYCLGLGSTLKYGYDRHITGKVFVGGQFFISYGYTWETDTSVPANATSFLYGAALNLKFGN